MTRQTIGLASDAAVERVRFPRGLGSLDAILGALATGDIRGTLTKMQDIAIYAGALMKILPRPGSGLVRAEGPVLAPVR